MIPIISIWLLLVLPDHSFFFILTTTANELRLQRISIPDFIHYIYFISLFFRKSQYFPFQCWVLYKGTTGNIFITSLVWRGPWLGIEPGTSRTWSQHSTTRLSRRSWYLCFVVCFCIHQSGAQFHNTLIRLRFNPIYFMQNYTYFKQFYQECLKQNI